MTTAIALREQATELSKQIAGPDFRKQVELALPGDVTTDRFVRAAITALLANPDIAQCEPNSIFNGLLKAAQDGLLADGREAALVKFGDKAAYLPMVSGFRKIAAESGWQLISKIVYAADSFEHEEGLEPKLVHHPVRPGDERGPIVAAYAIGRKVGQPVLFEVMAKEEIDKVKNVSRAKGGPWADWYERMAEKTVARRLFAKLPLGDRERARRVLEASAPEPAESTALMYGRVPGELPPAPLEDVTPGEERAEDDGQQAEEAKASAESASTGDASSVPDPVDELRALAKTLGVGEKTDEMILRKEVELDADAFDAWVGRQIAVAKQHIAEHQEAEESPFAAMAEKAQKMKGAGKQEKLA
jgi:recombination protein RecT